MSQQIMSIQAESATDQVTLTNMWEMVNGQFKKLSGQNEAGETKRLAIEKKLGVLSKGITDPTSGTMETKGQTMETGVTKIEKVWIRETRGRCRNPKEKIRHRNPK